MQPEPNNIIPINEKSAQYGFFKNVCDQLNQLTIQHIHPAIDSLITHLIEKFDEELERTSSNHDIMAKLELKNALLKNNEKIISLFKEQSSTSSFSNTEVTQEVTEGLLLLDNSELDQRLIWITAAEKMSDKDNIQQLFRIKNRFESTFPEFKDSIPATPEKLCESFSDAIDLINPEDTYKQQLLSWFTLHIKDSADHLWKEADKLLEDIGLELKVSTRASKNQTHQPSSNNEKSESNKLETSESQKHQTRTVDLAGLLAGLQIELIQQNTSISNLSELVQSTLDKKGDNSKLSTRHEDLINLIGMLFEYILDDHQLPENIRKCVSLLQIPILRAAILDHTFLTNRHHPARVLLNEMTSAGMKCKDNCFTDPVYLLIDSIVRIIISQSNENPNIFNESLERLRTELEIIHRSVEPKIATKEESFMNDVTVNEPILKALHKDNDNNVAKFSDLNDSEFDDAEEIILESSIPASSEAESQTEIEINSDDTEEIAHSSLDEEQPSTLPNFTPIDGLIIGQWVEFVGEGENHRLRCKLAQINKDANQYIFENRSGMKVAECDGKQLLTDIQSGSVVINPDVQIFDRALQAVFEKFKIR